jgi:lipooligosaccharide transport system permease protein
MTAFAAASVVVHRNYLTYKRVWWVFLTGFLEPVFYLFSIGVGVGAMINGFDYHGRQVPYVEFVAPAMLAASAFNGALLDATYGFFFKLKYDKVFEHQLATPLTTRDVARGEIAWSMMRGMAYSVGFWLIMVAMGLTSSWWSVLALPAALLIALTISTVGMAATTCMRSYQDFEFITLVQLPMFLFSATFFPITAFPAAVRWFVEFTPLYRGVVLVRELCLGVVTWESAFSVAYLLVFGLVGMRILGRRLDRLLLT